ncbi:MAG: hypothetical protein QM690_18815 [Sphingobium sp.]
MPSAPPHNFPRSLLLFALLYGGMTCIAGVLGAKQVALGPLAVEAGIFPFLLLVVLSSTTAELHGRRAADMLVRMGFVPLIAAMALLFISLSFLGERPIGALMAGQMLAKVLLSLLLVPPLIHLSAAIGRGIDGVSKRD